MIIYDKSKAGFLNGLLYEIYIELLISVRLSYEIISTLSVCEKHAETCIRAIYNK